MLHRVTIVSVVLLVGVQATAGAQPQVPDTSVDAIFSRWNNTTPGCAVGVAVGGTPTLLKAYGMADLEHDVPNTPDTIFEAGSVAKQFTAMAVILLAGDGKLSLDDPARKYVPELPDYGAPLTIRHMLTHTSGLRDWGSVAGIAGAPRTTRAYTHAHVLDIVSRQKALNFPPGTNWSYSNTGFNLAAIIVSRVSGRSFAEFSKRRIFEPLGMTRTSWRDDHQRIVKGRATAYATVPGGGYQTLMPFENVHGNGGLLTTVGDLLKWNENFVAPKVATPALVAEMQRVARLTDGRELDYALGLYARTVAGVKNVFHSGSTAGYRAHLNRFPEAHTSVAVLCNASDGQATDAAARVSELYLADRMDKSSGGVPGGPLSPADTPWPPTASLRELAADYRSDEAEVTLTAVVEKDQLVLRRRPGDTIRLRPRGPDTYVGAIGTVTFLRNAAGAVVGLSLRQERVWDLRFERR
jgi:CubicO group peptidase (beta-lactamase class C family)